ncbi:MAG TPA: TPM domain-containing protein [Polyangiaceae bacterium]|nr:TPM domain-containing protein [Polyangiaceae bacterium]
MTSNPPSARLRRSAGFFEPGGEAALVCAVTEVESTSCAEVVVAVRKQSGSYLHAATLSGAISAFVVLAFQLFSASPFAVVWMLADPVLAFLLGAWGASRSDVVRRLFTPRNERLRRVETYARAAFVERGIAATSKRSGVLVYISLLEREASVVPDDGVRAAVPDAEWRVAAGAVESAARQGRSSDVAAAIVAMKSVLSCALPRSADDVNELPDEVTSE